MRSIYRHRRDAAELAGHWFFPALAALLFSGVLLGFAKSFFFRAAFSNFPVSPIVLLHGTAMTAWFVLFLVQTFLVSTDEVNLHRRLGLFSLLLAVSIE